MAVTAQQIARQIGVSNATVSRVLNNSQPVRPETREAVLAAIRGQGATPRLLGPRPRKPVARSASAPGGVLEVLLVNRFPIVAIEPGVDPERPMSQLPVSQFFSRSARLATSFGRHIVDGILDELRAFDMRAVVQVTEDLRARSLLNEVNAANTRGLFLLGTYDDDVDAFLEKCRCPVVSFMTWAHNNGWPDYVGVDNFTGVRLGFDHLRQLGHTKIGYVAGELRFSPVFGERLAAYKSCLADAGLAYRDEWVCEGSCNLGPITASMKEVLQRADGPTAILCCFDGAAVAVRTAAERLGLQVPRDLSVVGFDDEAIAQLFSPPLTTVRVPTTLMGRHAVHLMMMRQRAPIRPGEGCSVRVTPTLTIRESTAAPRA